MRLLAFLVMFAIFLVGCNQENSKTDEVAQDSNDIETVAEVEEKEEVEEVAKTDEKEEVESTEDEISEYAESDDVLSHEKYLEVVSESIDIFKDIMGMVNGLMVDALEDTSLLEDEKWMADFKLVFEPIEAMSNIFVELEKDGKVPSDMYEIHINVKESMVLMSQAGDTLYRAIENGMDIRLYTEGVELMTESANKLNNVLNIIDEMQNNEQYPLTIDE